MSIKSWLFFIISLIAIFSCTQGNSDKNHDKANESNTIRITAQNQPFGESIEFDMPVQNALEKLEFADPETEEIDSIDLVLGLFINETHMAIPLIYLSAYEVANFSIEANNYLVTWCSIVGTARLFEGGNDDQPEFDFGRGLYKNNLLVVDRKTQTVWNQLSGKAIHGEKQGEDLNPLPAIQSTWGFWKTTYPDTKLLVNRDTSNPIFPDFADENPRYYKWNPGDGRPTPTDNHQIETLGMGINLGSSSVFFPFEKLFTHSSPINQSIDDQMVTIHFNESGLTAWAEDSQENMIPASITYNWAWKEFYPDSEVFGE